MKNLINTKDAARRAGYSVGSFRNLMMERGFPAPRSYGAYGLKFFDWGDIAAWLRSHRSRQRRGV